MELCTATSPAPFGGTLPKGEGFELYNTLQFTALDQWRDMRRQAGADDDDKKSGGVIVMAPVDESLIKESDDE